METDTMLLQKNVDTIAKHKIYMLNLIEELDKESYPYEGVIQDIFMSTSQDGISLVGVRKKDHDFYLNSRYNSSLGVERWVQTFTSNQQFGIAIIVGVANFQYIRAMRKAYPEVRLFVYEPDKFIWNETFIKMDLSDILSDNMINIVVGRIGELYLKELLNISVDYANYKFVQLMISPNYDVLYADSCKKVREILLQHVQGIMVNRNTLFKFNQSYTMNRCMNMYDSLRQYNAGDAGKAMEDIDFDKVPAILVSAGPSLDKNVHLLKEIQGKAFIVAVDASIRSLLHADVIPDMTVMIDPNKLVSVLYEDERVKDVPLLISLDAKHAIKSYHRGHRFYFDINFKFINELWRRYGKKYPVIESAGSVANDAFSFIRSIGFRTIIMVGQDLAYTGDKVHSEHSYGNLRNNDVSTKQETYVIKDIYGQDVKTDFAMDIFRRWFEDQIKLHSELQVIDATEGGAKIEGAEILTLREALDRECHLEMDINFKELLNQIPRAYTEEEQLEIEKYFGELAEEMKGSIKKKLKDAERAYGKLEELNQKRKYSGSDFSTTLKKVENYNKWLIETPEVDMLSMFSDRENYDVMENIFSNTQDEYENIKTIAESGLKMVRAYRKGADKFAEIMQMVKDSFKENDVK